MLPAGDSSQFQRTQAQSEVVEDNTLSKWTHSGKRENTQIK